MIIFQNYRGDGEEELWVRVKSYFGISLSTILLDLLGGIVWLCL